MAVARHARAMLGMVRSELKEVVATGADGTLWTNAEILSWLNEGQDQIVGEIIDTDEDFFGDYFDISTSATVAAYDLPPRFVHMIQVEYVAGGSRDPVPESRVGSNNQPVISSGAALGPGGKYAYALYGDTINFDPTPLQSVSPMFRCWFVGDAMELTYGKASAGSSTTLTLQAADDAVGFGAAATDDFYNRGWIILTGGLGAGQRRRIVDYSGDTKIAVVSPAWSTVPDATTEYALEGQIPRPVWRLPVLFAAIAAKGKYKQDARHLISRFNALHDRIPQIFEQRTKQQRSVAVYDLDR